MYDSAPRTSNPNLSSTSTDGYRRDQFWGDRSGTLIDPYGYQWTIATRREDLTPEEMNQRQAEFMKQFAPR